MAWSASSAVAISTKPKPRERPVSRSVTTAADSTWPAAANTSRSRSVDVENARPPINSFCAMRRLLRCFHAVSSCALQRNADGRWRQGLARRGAVVECLTTGRARVVAAREGPATAVTVLADRAFTWPEFDRWQAIFAASGTFPARWDGLQVVPVPQTSRDARAAYGLRKLDLLFEWLDALTRG